MVLVSIYDTVALVWNSPVAFPSLGSAIRSFSTAMQDQNSQFYSHPGDFEIYHLGSFDPASGKIELISDYVRLGSGSDYIVPK